jgi:4-azaleucine resistance transporter AzlC
MSQFRYVSRIRRNPMSVNRATFFAGARAAVPMLVAVLPFGVICGVAMVASGISPAMAMLMSLLVFAGASMIASAQLLSSGAPAALAILATLFINLRFMMYSASLRQHFAREPLRWRLLLSYLVADNAYGLFLQHFAERPDDPGKRDYFLGSSSLVWLVWQLAVLAGILIGAGVPASWRLEWAAPLAFIAMSIPLLRDRAMVAAALAAGITALVANDLPLRLGIAAAALVGITAGMLMQRRET